MGAPVAPAGRGRLVFSSCEYPTRATGSKAVSKQNVLVASLVSSVSGIAESLFATLFPSDCRICGAPLINIARLPVCEDCLSSIRPIAGGVCAICGERLVSEAQDVRGECVGHVKGSIQRHRDIPPMDHEFEGQDAQCEVVG